MGRLEAINNAVGDTTDESDRRTTKTTHSNKQLKTVLEKFPSAPDLCNHAAPDPGGKLLGFSSANLDSVAYNMQVLKWKDNKNPVNQLAMGMCDDFSTDWDHQPERFAKSPRNKSELRKGLKREENKRQRSALAVSAPRTPDPKSSFSSHEPVDGKGSVKDLSCRRNTPCPVAGDSGKSEDVMRNNCDRYRLMYLIVRLEQQQDHIRDVVTSIRHHGNKRSLRNMIKIKEALSKLYGSLLSIRDDDPGAYTRIGTSLKDLDEFFNMVESVCSAAEDIPADVCEPNGRDLPECGQRHLTNAAKGVPAHQPLNCLKPEAVLHVAMANEIDRMKTKYDDFLGDKTNCAGDLSSNLRAVWPSLNTNERGRQNNDIELQSLMKEIDTLMDDVGLSGGENEAITYEELMTGVDMQQASNREEKREQMQEIEGQIKHSVVKTKTAKRDDADKFIEELDQLLDEAETQ